MNPGKVRFAILGLGHIGLRYAQLLNRMPGAELAGAIDWDIAARKRFAASHAVDCFACLEDFFETSSADVVCVCTPSGLHTAHALKVLDYGTHVLVEKPMGLDSEGCRAVLAYAEAQGRQVFVALQNRHAVLARWLKHILNEGLLGQPRVVQLTCFWNRSAEYYAASAWRSRHIQAGGILYTQFSHFLDLLYWLFGTVEPFSAQSANLAHQGVTDFEDTFTGTFWLANGGLGSMSFSTAAYRQSAESSLSILAERGNVKLAGQHLDRLEYCEIEGYRVPPSLLEQARIADPTQANHRLMLEEIIEVLQGRLAPTSATSDAVAVVALVEQLYAQAKT